MAESFDPYYKWLGIPSHEQPPNHYRLLAINLCESDPDVIEAAADRQMSHLRSYQSGKHSAESQKLLNECAAARLTLLNPQKKAEYDRQLREKLGSASTSQPQTGVDWAIARPEGQVETVSPEPQPVSEATPLIDVGGASPVERLGSRRRTVRSAWHLPAIGVATVAVLSIVAWLALRPSDPQDAGKQQRGAGAASGAKPHAKHVSTPSQPKTTTSGATVRATTPVPSPEVPRGSDTTAAPSTQHDRWQAFDLHGNVVMDDFVRVAQGQLSTRASYAGPIEIAVVARAIKNSIRLRAYHGGVIWNWEDNPSELRVGRPDQRIASAAVTPLPTGTWYRLKWRITANQTDVYVDDKLVFHGSDGPYIGEPCPVWMETYEHGSAFDVKSLEVTPLLEVDAAAPSLADQGTAKHAVTAKATESEGSGSDDQP